MAKGFKHGSGGASLLNFKVVGGTSAPSNPKKNTIWVNTSTPITGWGIGDFSNPGWSMPEGYVYIDADTSANVGGDFNALKKNEIWLKPIQAKQRVNGAWVDKTAKSYQGGAWVDWWNGELYKDGNEYTGVTGGWRARDMKVTGATAKGAAPVIRKGSNSVTVSQETYAAGGVYEIVNDIDLSKYSTLTFKVSANNYGYKALAVYDRSITTLGTSATALLANALAGATVSKGHTGTVTINVSGINRTACIGIALYCDVTGNWPTLSMTEAIMS